MNIEDVTASRIQKESVKKIVEGLPEGMVKSELLKALDRVETKISRELDAAQSAWEREPILKRIETSNISVRDSNDLLVLLAHCLLEEAGLVCVGNLAVGSSSSAVGASNATTDTANDSELRKPTTIPSSSGTSNNSSTGDSTTAQNDKEKASIVPNGWNTGADGGAYGLQYVLPTSTSTSAKPGEALTLKALPIGDMVSFHLIQNRTGKSQAIELNITDFVANRGRIIRVHSIADLRAKLRSQLIDRLFPPPSLKRSTSTTGRRDPLRVGGPGDGGRRGNPEFYRPPYTPFAPGGLGGGGVGGLGGDFDRDLRPHFGGGFGGPHFGRGGSGGSLMGPDHPMFRGGNGASPVGGRRGYPPVPGARFDPYGPGVGIPPRRGGARGARPTPGPTPDHLPPPRFDGRGDDNEPPDTMFF
eukprot:g4605.t1